MSLQEIEARRAQEELERRMYESRMKDEEAKRLHMELEHARIQMEENKKALDEALACHAKRTLAVDEDDDKTSEQSES